MPAVLALAGCAGPTMPAMHAPAPVRAPASGEVLVGAADVDITPPVGAATWGHGNDARATQGIWSRVHCRPVVIVVASQSPLVIVPCDLPAMSELLHRHVAARLADLPTFAPARLVITATHTHAGPGHFLDGQEYGSAISSRTPGYDEKMTVFFADQIALGVREAWARKVKAKIGWGAGSVEGLTHNRNLTPHEANAAPDRFPWFSPGHGPARADERATDPRLLVLRADDLAGCPIASMTFFAMHPTVLPNTNRLWGGDAFAVASRELERRMRVRASKNPACAKIAAPPAPLVNTNEGDVIANFARSTFVEAERVGLEAAERAWAAYERADLSPTTELEAAYLELHMPNAPLSGKRRLASKPSIGYGAPSGSREHGTAFGAVLPELFYEGHRSDQGPDAKAPVFGFVQQIVGGSEGYPTHVSLTLAHLGGKWIAFVPGEFTVGAGHQVIGHIARVTGAARDDVVLGGLANGYIQYVTTAAEYQLQRYEGASDLYGQWTAELVGERFAYLASALGGGDVRDYEAWLRGASDRAYAIDELGDYAYATGPQRDRFETGAREEPLETLKGRGPISFCRLPGHEPIVLCYGWLDGGPGRVPAHGGQGPWIKVVNDFGVVTSGGPTCANVHETRGACTAVDDETTSFLTQAHEEDAWGRYLWTTTFRPTRAMWDDIQRHARFRIEAGAPPNVKPSDSPWTSAKTLPPVCTVEAASLCDYLE
jgi:neutral ceramidase